MRSRFQAKPNRSKADINIYADKSSLILDWLLRIGSMRESFSIREAAKEVGVSLGLVQRVFNDLAVKGFLQIEGVRTAKKFRFNQPKKLLESWLQHYSITKKCKIHTYSSAFSKKEEWFAAIKKSGLDHQIVLALHSASAELGYKNSNLEGLELYILDDVRDQLEIALQLAPREQGYEVLLIEPYYKMLLKQSMASKSGIRVCPLLLNLLDLYHFPLRGREQAEAIIQRSSQMRQLYGIDSRR